MVSLAVCFSDRHGGSLAQPPGSLHLPPHLHPIQQPPSWLLLCSAKDTHRAHLQIPPKLYQTVLTQPETPSLPISSGPNPSSLKILLKLLDLASYPGLLCPLTAVWRLPCSLGPGGWERVPRPPVGSSLCIFPQGTGLASGHPSQVRED